MRIRAALINILYCSLGALLITFYSVCALVFSLEPFDEVLE